MSYLALYRKFRPQKWADVKGQDHITKTLKNQLKTGRIGHAYLFCGTRGTGKTTAAKIFARAVNCQNPVDGEPCCECAGCQSALKGGNINIVEIDAASNNSVDNARALIEEVEYPPIGAEHKVYIIDEVHMLSSAAFNALLKTIEEPPSYVIFILATTEYNKIPKTILSRCQRYDFHRIPPSVISDRLREVADSEKIDVDKKALDYIALQADGALRDALSLLDQCSSFYENQKLSLDNVLQILGTVDIEVFAEFFDCIIKSDVLSALLILDRVSSEGKELMQFTGDFIWYLRNLMLMQAADGADRIIDVSDENKILLKKQAQSCDEAEVMRLIALLSEVYNQMRYETQKRTLLEMAVVRAVHPSEGSGLSSIEPRLRALEEKEIRVLNALKLIESGKFTAVSAGSGTSESIAETSNKKILPKALPEEIKEIVKNWNDFVPDMPSSVRPYMLAAPAPKLSAADDGSLVIVLFSKMHADYLAQGFPKEALTDYLSKKTGKEIRLRVEYMPDNASFARQMPDLSDIINMEIETVDN